MGYVNASGDYYDGDRQGSDREVPRRPSQHYAWDGYAWVENPVPVAAERRGEILTRLAVIDTKSVRPAREASAALAAGQPAPEFAVAKLSALEAEAAALRAELRELPASD